MCEILGASACSETDFGGYLREFFSHGGANPHGWGLALFEKGQPKIEKEPVSALESVLVKIILRRPVEAKLLLAHIRFATKGAIEYRNTHPFMVRDVSGLAWTLVHNGTIFESDELSGYFAVQEGTTDSERVLRYLVACINTEINNKSRSLSEEERIRIVERMLYTVTPENKVNLLISDGSLLYVHTNYRHSLHVLRRPSFALFSTKPLSDDQWEELPLNTLLVFNKGKLIYRGKPHNNEFFDCEEKTRLLFLDYAGI